MRKKSPLSIRCWISLLSSLMSAFLASLTVPCVKSPGVEGFSTEKLIVMRLSPSVILNLAVGVVGTACFLLLEYKLGLSDAVGGEGLEDDGGGEGDLPRDDLIPASKGSKRTGLCLRSQSDIFL